MSVSEHALAAVSWAREAAVPAAPESGSLVVALDSLRALTTVRWQVRAFLLAGLPAGIGDAGEDAVDSAVLVIDELTSNALRHGSAPSRLLVRDEPGQWVVVVTDSAPDRAPVPAVHRAAGAGGYGLHVVADLTSSHGVHFEVDQKLVWACLTKPR